MLRPALWFLLDTTQTVIDTLQLIVDLTTVTLAAGDR